MNVNEKLIAMHRVGNRGAMSLKGDYTRVRPKRRFRVIDEVYDIVGDSRYAFELLGFDNGARVVRAAYWTAEGRIRRGANTLRVGLANSRR